MKKINIIYKGIKIGELIFDIENKTVDIQFIDEQESKNYFTLIKIIIERIRMMAYPDLIFDHKSGHIKNVNEDIFFAIKQEFFTNFEWILQD